MPFGNDELIVSMSAAIYERRIKEKDAKINELEDVIKKAKQFNVKIDNGYGRDDTYMDVLRQGELLAIALKDKP